MKNLITLIWFLSPIFVYSQLQTDSVVVPVSDIELSYAKMQQGEACQLENDSLRQIIRNWEEKYDELQSLYRLQWQDTEEFMTKSEDRYNTLLDAVKPTKISPMIGAGGYLNRDFSNLGIMVHGGLQFRSKRVLMLNLGMDNSSNINLGASFLTTLN